VQTSWLNKFAAALSTVAIAGASAHASPASMALSGSPTTSTAPAPVATQSYATAPDYTRPSARISATRNPVQYLKAAFSELPIGKKNAFGATTNSVVPPAKQYSDAIALSTPPGAPTPQLFISAAQMCERQGDVAQARQSYQQALTMWPGHVDVLRAAARMEDRAGNLPLAENLYRQAVTSNPQHGLCLARQGKLDASVQTIEQAIQIQPDKALYRNNAATVLVEMRQDQRALAHLAAVHGPADANYNFGQLLVQRGRAADATPYFQAAVEQNPQMQPAHVALAKLRGQSAPSAPTTTTSPAGQPAAPLVGPQNAPPAGPQLGYPATPQSPAWGTSSYMPPAYYAPRTPFAPSAPGSNSVPTRYLPPVAMQPGAAPVQR
jgi:tetratricopeptide (TPR) repeat protein